MSENDRKVLDTEENPYAGAPDLEPTLEREEEDFCEPFIEGEKVDISYSHWKKEAEQGDVLAKFFLGQCYEKGEEVEQDYLKAAPF